MTHFLIALAMLTGITALFGQVAAVWYAIGFIAAAVIACWEAGRKIEAAKAEDHPQ